MKQYLEQVANENGIFMSKTQVDQFDVFYRHLLEVNKVMNLTAITEMEDVVIKHFMDSISILQYASFEPGQKIIDVGTGAGFPGVPLAIMLPEIQFTLMDSLNKRLKFIEESAELCGLSNITTVHSRAEDLGQNPEHREKYDICVSRAVANLSTLLEYCVPLVRIHGKFISFKSRLAEDELQNAEHAVKTLGCQLNNQIDFSLKGNESYERTFLIFEKTKNTPKRYPRQAGTPKKKPL